MVDLPVPTGHADGAPSNAFRIPVRRERVVLTLADGSLHEGTLFRAVDGDLDALFESPETFLPVEELGVVRLYNRRAIAAMSVFEREETDLAALRVRRWVVVHLRSGRVLEGELTFFAERANARSLDHLNDDTKSFAIYHDGRLHQVAKDHVAHVEERRR